MSPMLAAWLSELLDHLHRLGLPVRGGANVLDALGDGTAELADQLLEEVGLVEALLGPRRPPR